MRAIHHIRRTDRPSHWPVLTLLACGIALFVLGLATGVGIGAVRWRTPPGLSAHEQALRGSQSMRLWVLNEHAKQMPKGGTLVLGDSLVEQQRSLELCGPTFNAGIGGFTTGQWAAHAGAIIDTIRPSRAVIALGTNDHLSRVGSAKFSEAYASILARLKGVPIVSVGIRGGSLDPAITALGVKLVPWPVADDDLMPDSIHITPAGVVAWQGTVAKVLCGQS